MRENVDIGMIKYGTVFRLRYSLHFNSHGTQLKLDSRPKNRCLRTGASFDLTQTRLSQADFEVAGYLWLDVLEVDINVGYRKHLTVRISIRRQLGARPIERVKRVTLLRRASSRCVSRGVHHRQRRRSMHSTAERYASARERRRKRAQTSTIPSYDVISFTYLFLRQNYHLSRRGSSGRFIREAIFSIISGID